MRDRVKDGKKACSRAWGGKTFAAPALALLLAAGCGGGPEQVAGQLSDEAGRLVVPAGSALDGIDACSIALTVQDGDSTLDREIRSLQERAPAVADPEPVLERLGWLFVSKARSSYDPGYYRLAEQTALCIEARHPESAATLLLRGHVRHNLHAFKEAEALARRVVAIRGLPFDYGLLGDALMEQGKLDEAVEAYQKMVDLRPDIHAYSRIAHMRWLKGELKGAIEVVRMAARAGSPRAPEAAAWAYTRLALYELQAGGTERALGACDRALDYQRDYAPALHARGRILLVQGHVDQAVRALSRAATLNPLPEYQWLLADALREAGRADDAHVLEDELKRQGGVEDARTLSLFLATRGEDAQTAVRLARSEMESRQDIFTLDALAWAFRAAGMVEEARQMVEEALREGTKDARLFLHAALIYRDARDPQAARHWLRQAEAIQQLLFPSERKQLLRALEDEMVQMAHSINS